MKYLIFNEDYPNPVFQTDDFDEAVEYVNNHDNCEIFDQDIGEYGGYINIPKSDK